MSAVEVIHRYLVNHRGESNLYGDCRHVLLACGHIKHTNPTSHYKVGMVVRCFACKP
jgi:hypothetical protein